jgi:hypothetical protein
MNGSPLHRGVADQKGNRSTGRGQKNAGLKAVTLIATFNPVSQVLW